MLTRVHTKYTKQLTPVHVCYLFSASAVDDLQMKELQDQLEAETYFSVRSKELYCLDC